MGSGGGGGGAGGRRHLVRDGRRKARDLPEPVSAWRSTDSPAAMRGSAAAWIGVGVRMPRAASEAATAGGRLGRRSAKAGAVRALGEEPSAIAALPPQIHKTDPTHNSADARCGRTSSSIVRPDCLKPLKREWGAKSLKYIFVHTKKTSKNRPKPRRGSRRMPSSRREAYEDEGAETWCVEGLLCCFISSRAKSPKKLRPPGDLGRRRSQRPKQRPSRSHHVRGPRLPSERFERVPLADDNSYVESYVESYVDHPRASRGMSRAPMLPHSPHSLTRMPSHVLPVVVTHPNRADSSRA